MSGLQPEDEIAVTEKGVETDKADKVEEWLAKRLAEFERDLSADKDNRREAYDDIRFVADPASQWDERDREAREKEGRPCPALNRLGPFIKQISNTVRRNKPEIEIKPVETADIGGALVIGGIVQHIERRNNASRQYARWADDGVTCGNGNLRGYFEPSDVNPEHMEVSFDHIEDPNSVVWDASAVRPDRLDARHCWVIDYLPQDAVDDEYPDALGEWPDGEESTAWTDWHDSEAEEFRVCEYYKVSLEEMHDYVHVLRPEETRTLSGDVEAPEGFVRTATRREKVCRAWLLTAGKVLEGGLEGIVVPGGRVPIFPYIPNEKRVGRTKIRKGLVRDAKDSVRMINWAMALMIEAMAATPKPKWIGEASTFEGYEDEWDRASTSNRSYLRHKDGKPAPTYNQPPPFNVGLVNAMQVFDENIKQVTGIYDASLGARSNETSGTAIRAREEQGDTATYDYIDEFNYCVGALGQWLVKVIPDIYSEERQIRILGEDHKEKVVTINGFDPVTKQRVNPVERAVYDVFAKAGPGFSTQREQAAETIKMAISAAPNLAPILLDMMIEMEDWPGAERTAKRLNTMLPPEIRAAENGEPPPQPQPDPKMLAEAMREQAEADKTQAEAQHQRLETLLTQLQAVMAGIPPQLLAPQPSGGPGMSAPPNGGMSPVAP